MGYFAFFIVFILKNDKNINLIIKNLSLYKFEFIVFLLKKNQCLKIKYIDLTSF